MELKFRLQDGNLYEFKYSKFSEFIDNLEPEPGVIIDVLEPFTLEDFETAQIEYNKYVVFKEALEDIITIRNLWSKEELSEFSKYDLNNPVLEWLMIRDNIEDKEIKEILSLKSLKIEKTEKEIIKLYEENNYLCCLLCYLCKNSNQQKFNFLCRNGILEVAQWLYNVSNFDSKNPINIHYVFDYCFRASCVNGHLEVAQWLFSLGDVDIHARDDYAFQNSCVKGHLEVAQWIYLICQSPSQSFGQFFGGINIHMDNEFAFRWACINGHLEVAQWLYSLGGVNIHVCNDDAFRWTCHYNNLEVAQWLHFIQTPPRIKMSVYIEVFKNACSYGHLEMAQWLYDYIYPIIPQIKYHLYSKLFDSKRINNWIKSLE